MTIRKIINIPDPVLREVSRPVERVDDQLRALLDSMLETMYDAPGIGLAGIQIGEKLRIITIDCGDRDKADAERAVAWQAAEGGPAECEEFDALDESVEAEDVEPVRKPMFFINPEIVSLADESSIYEEGCLSIPEYFADVERPSGCTIKYIDRDGKPQIMEATGILSTCLLHEIDHLNGILFIDHISRLKRDMVIKKFTKIAKQNGKPSGKTPANRMVG